MAKREYEKQPLDSWDEKVHWKEELARKRFFEKRWSNIPKSLKCPLCGYTFLRSRQWVVLGPKKAVCRSCFGRAAEKRYWITSVPYALFKSHGVINGAGRAREMNMSTARLKKLESKTLHVKPDEAIVLTHHGYELREATNGPSWQQRKVWERKYEQDTEDAQGD